MKRKRGRGSWAGILGELTSVLQERCRRLSPRQYLPPIVGLEGVGVGGQKRYGAEGGNSGGPPRFLYKGS